MIRWSTNVTAHDVCVVMADLLCASFSSLLGFSWPETLSVDESISGNVVQGIKDCITSCIKPDQQELMILSFLQ